MKKTVGIPAVLAVVTLVYIALGIAGLTGPAPAVAWGAVTLIVSVIAFVVARRRRQADGGSSGD